MKTTSGDSSLVKSFITHKYLPENKDILDFSVLVPNYKHKNDVSSLI